MENLQSITIAGTVNELNNTSLNAFVKGIDGLTLSQAQAALSTRALTDAQKEQILASAGLLQSTQAITLEEVKQMASSMSLSTKKKEEILTTLQGAYAENEWNKEKLEAIVASGGEAGAIAESILAKKAENAENVKNIAGRKALTASLKEELATRLALMASNPAVWIAGIAAVSVGLIALQEKFSKSLEECTEELEGYNSEFDTAQSSVESLETELKTCTSRLDELQKLADNGTISIIEQDEYERLQKTNDELERNIRIEREKAQLSAIDAAKSADETLTKKVTSNYIRGDVSSYEGVILEDQILSVSPQEELEASIVEYNKLQEQIDTLNQSYDNGSISADDYNKQLIDLTDQQTKARTRASEMSDILVECEQAYKNLDNTGGELSTTQTANYQSVEAVNQKYQNFLDTINGVNEAFKNLDITEKAKTIKDKYTSNKEMSDWIDNLSEQDLDTLASINQEKFTQALERQKEQITKTTSESLSDLQKNLEDEYQKIQDWGLGDYAEEIKNGTIQSVFGNVDMDKRTIITWSDELKQTYADALASWDYDPEIGSIDTVFGGSNRFGEELNGVGWEVAFTPILPDGTFLSKDAVYDYINSILVDAYADDGKITEDELTAIDAQGRQVGSIFIQGIFAGIDDSQNYDNNGNWAETVGRLMHFSGDFGAIKIATNDIEKSRIAFNNATLSADNYSAALKEVKDAQNQTDADKTDISKPFVELNKSLQTLTDNASLLSSINKQISETGRISADNLAKINEAFPEDKYPEMTKALYDYQKGLISTQELFDELEKCYNSDKDNYIRTLANKSLMDKKYLDMMATSYPSLFNELQGLYGQDFAGWKSVEQAKLDITLETVKKIAELYKNFYKAMGVNNFIDYNAQVVKNATGIDKPTSNLFSRFYSKDSFNDVASQQNSEYADLLNDIDNVLSSAEKMKSALDNYGNDVYDNLSSTLDFSWNSLSGDNSSSSQSAEKINWIERLINKISTAYSRLKNVVSDTADTWLNRNNALSDSMEVLLQEIEAQQQAYEYYMDRFNSYGLDGYYKDQIANGSINIDVIYDDDLKDAISECQDFYDKAQDAKDEVQSLNIELSSLSKQKFDNVSSQFDNVIKKIEAFSTQLSNELDIIESKGLVASKFLNEKLIEQEQKNLDKLIAEREALTKALNESINSGRIQAESDDWYDMQSAIDEVTSSIQDATKSLINYKNELRQISWDAFDKTRDSVTDLIDETDFLVEMLKGQGTTDDNGNLNDNGIAAQALLAQKYQLYLNQASEYGKEILAIEEELANDPFNQTLIDRKQELIEAQREAIKSAQDEKDAIKDLVSNAYSDYINNLNDIIDKYKELMSTIKDAYDYEKNIRKQTETLNALEKQYSAYQGDNSEEGKKNIQQLKVQINDAKEDLKETEYEKLISDTEKILDELVDNTQSWLDERIDNIDGLIEDVINQSNENSSNIAETITNTANEFGFKLSENMSSIWQNSTNNITNVLSEYGNKFNESQTTLNNTVNTIKEFTERMLANSDAEAARVAEELARQQAEQNANTDGGYSGSYDIPDWSWDSVSNNSSNDSGNSSGVDWIYSPDYYTKEQLNIDTSIVDRLKYNDFDSSFNARSQYYDQMGGEGQYYGTYDQNVFMLDWMKRNGYANGTRSALKGWHLYDEKGLGSEVILTKDGVLKQFEGGEHVFDAQSTENLWRLAQIDPSRLMPNLNNTNLPKMVNRNMDVNTNVEFGDLTFNFPNVKNYEDFMRQAQQDPKFERMVQNMTLGQTLGQNSLNKLQF